MAGKALLSEASGRSLTIGFWLSEGMQDPIVQATELPLLAWATAVWERRLPVALMGHAVAAVQAKRGLTWQGVRGPIAAVLLTLARIGWRALSATEWLSHRGERLDLTEIS
eukprot:9954544-Lingulodinium_polyedra.AAC.1